MWTNNTINAKIKGDQVFNILNGFENIDYNIYFREIKESKITRGHNTSLYVAIAECYNCPRSPLHCVIT